MPECRFTRAPSPILPGEGWRGREGASGAVTASALVVHEPLRALAHPPASQPGPHLVMHPQLQVRLPLLAASWEQEPCSQLCCPWGQLSPAEPHTRGCLPWPLTTRQVFVHHPHMVCGSLLCLATNHWYHCMRPLQHAGIPHDTYSPELSGSILHQLPPYKTSSMFH